MDKKLIIITLIVLIIVFAVSFVYKNNKIEETVSSITQITAQKQDDTLTDDDILLRNDESGYILYYKDKTATLVNGDLSLEFSAWYTAIETETPEMYYEDFDRDGEKELLIKLVSGTSELNGKTIYVYSLYLFEITETDGKESITYIVAGGESWKTAYKYAIRFDVNQLLMDPKYIQIALNDKEEPINYDEKTGLTDNKYTYYAEADHNENGEYYTLVTANFGAGIYTVIGDKITVDIQVLANYEEADGSFLLGHLHSGMMIYDGSFRTEPNTISFVPLEDKIVDDPRISAE